MKIYSEVDVYFFFVHIHTTVNDAILIFWRERRLYSPTMAIERPHMQGTIRIGNDFFLRSCRPRRRVVQIYTCL